MATTATADPAAIERDLSATRARLDTRLSELAARLSPGQILDETLGMMRTREGADFARNLGQAVREKPIPTALVGIGLAWMMVGPRDHGLAISGSRSARPLHGEPDLVTRAWTAGREVIRAPGEADVDYRSRVTEARGKVLGLTRSAQETAETFSDRVQEALFAARDRVSDAASGVADQMSGFGRAASETAQGVADAARARMHDLRDGAAGIADQARDLAGQVMPSVNGSLGGLASAIGDNPALLGALGLAAGALLGALMPITDFEREHLGEAARGLTSGLFETARTATERGAEVARAAVDAGRETVRDASQHAQDIAGRADQAARDIAGAAQQQAQDVAGRVRENAQTVGAGAADAAPGAGKVGRQGRGP